MKRYMAAVVATAALISPVVPALAQDFPTRPVELTLGFPAGGSLDAVARALAVPMGESLHQRVVVINRDGANGLIGSQYVALGRSDGYSVLVGPTSTLAQITYSVANATFGPDDLQFICQIYENVLAVVVPKDSQYKTLKDVIAAAKSKPGQLNYAHFGVNGLDHMMMTRLQEETGIEVTGVPFRGETAIFPDLMSGRLDFAMGTVYGSRDKPLRVLAVMSDTRHPAFPDTPTMKELGLPSLMSPQIGLYVPKKTPQPVVAKLEKSCEQAVAAPSFKEFMAKGQMQIKYLDHTAFTKAGQFAIGDQVGMAKRMNVKPQ
jgi:tripartite-type tricarboxylate transporter receptor subunit TctC